VLRSVDSNGATGVKVFGLGLSKTGTSSLSEALSILGYRAVHNPTDDDSMLSLLSGNLRCRAIAENDAICDIMFSRHFRELDRLYSQSLFILTERDRESWHASCARHWMGRPLSLARLWNEDLVDFQVYGTALYRRSLFDDAYDQHYGAVAEYFAKTDRLLRLNICAGEGWEKLCGFLHVSIPLLPFPHICPQPWLPPSARSRVAETDHTANAASGAGCNEANKTFKW
jgi:hypothetical protein